MSADMGRLVRMEVELAKVEATEKFTEAAKAGAMFSSMAVTGFLALQVLSVTAALALALVMPTVVAFLIVGVAYLVLTGLLFAQGRKRMAEFSRKPMHSAQNLKDDLKWAKSAVSQGMSGPESGSSYPGRMWNGRG